MALTYLSGGRIQGTASDKSSVTNVSVGTRYEETDTRKIYRRVSSNPWTDPQSKYTIDGTKITKVGTAWDGYAISTTGALPATNPVITGTGNSVSSGLLAFTWLDSSGDPRGETSSWDESVIAYGLYFGGGNIKVYEEGTTLDQSTSWSSTDVFTIHMSSTQVIFKKNGTEFYTIPDDDGTAPNASKEYYLIGNLYTNGHYITASSDIENLVWKERGTAA